MYLKLSGGDYVFPLTTVAPHQTTVIDVRKLRDSQVPDVNGQTIPAGEKRGQIQWSLTGGVDRVVIGRSEQVDLVRGISSNYACQNCCPNNFFDGWLTPVQLDTPVGTCSVAPFNFCVDVRQEFRIKTPNNSIYFLGTQANRRDCRDGLRITVSTGVASQTFTLGTVN
jgi:hypothetical protein